MSPFKTPLTDILQESLIHLMDSFHFQASEADRSTIEIVKMVYRRQLENYRLYPLFSQNHVDLIKGMIQDINDYMPVSALDRNIGALTSEYLPEPSPSKSDGFFSFFHRGYSHGK